MVRTDDWAAVPGFKDAAAAKQQVECQLRGTVLPVTRSGRGLRRSGWATRLSENDHQITAATRTMQERNPAA